MRALRAAAAAAAFYNNVKSITCLRKVSAPDGKIVFPIPREPGSLGASEPGSRLFPRLLVPSVYFIIFCLRSN